MGFRGGPGASTPGRIDYSGVTLKMLLARAYNVKPGQITGPDRLDEERYAIVAKLPPQSDIEQFGLMLQGLLTERFQIQLHRETKILPVYRLTIGRNGPKLKPAETTSELPNDPEAIAATHARHAAQLAPMMNGERGPVRNFRLFSATTTKFIETLSSYLDRPVKDGTHLEGLYAFELSWVPDQAEPSRGTAADGAVTVTPTGPSIFSAVQEQLGLKLQPENEQFEVLVIDKVSKLPTEN